MEIHEGLQTCTLTVKHDKHFQLKVCQKKLSLSMLSHVIKGNKN